MTETEQNDKLIGYSSSKLIDNSVGLYSLTSYVHFSTVYVVSAFILLLYNSIDPFNW